MRTTRRSISHPDSGGAANRLCVNCGIYVATFAHQGTEIGVMIDLIYFKHQIDESTDGRVHFQSILYYPLGALNNSGALCMLGKGGAVFTM